jgi:hypothetical protein
VLHVKYMTHTNRETGKVHAQHGLNTRTLCGTIINSTVFDPKGTSVPGSWEVLIARITCSKCILRLLELGEFHE